MRRKSIGATSQAFHEPMSTGAFLEFLTGMQAWGPVQRLKCWSEDGNPASHGTVQLRLRKPSNAPQGQRIGGYGSVLRPGPMGLRRNKKLKTWLGDPGPRGLWARSPGGLGPGPPGLGARPTRGLGPLRFFRKPPVGSLATLSAFGNHPTRPPRSAD